MARRIVDLQRAQQSDTAEAIAWRTRDREIRARVMHEFAAAWAVCCTSESAAQLIRDFDKRVAELHAEQEGK